MNRTGFALAMLLAAIANAQVEVVTSEGIHLVTRVEDGHIRAFDGAQWHPRFW